MVIEIGDNVLILSTVLLFFLIIGYFVLETMHGKHLFCGGKK